MEGARALTERFLETVSRHRDKLAVESETSALTYGDLETRAVRLADQIHARGQAGNRDKPIAVLMNHDVGLIVALLGILLAGRSYLPLGPSSPVNRLRSLRRAVPSEFLLTDPENRNTARVISQEASEVLLVDLAADQPPATYSPRLVPFQSPAVVLLTSGSSGDPKAVCHSHQSIVTDIDRYISVTGLDHRDHVGLTTECSFAPSIFTIFGALLTGASLHVFDLRRHGISKLKPWMSRAGISLLYTVPTVFRKVATNSGNVTDEYCQGLRLWHLGGEPVLAKDLHLMRRCISETAKVLCTLGSTETLFIAWNMPDLEADRSDDIVPVGRPFPDVHLRIEDEFGSEVSAGCVGELVVRSPTVTHGYLHRPDLSAGRFIEPAGDSGDWTYRTGDLVRSDEDGLITYMGRNDLRVKVAGVRVDPIEVQSILGSLEAVREACVLPSGSVETGFRLTSFLVPANDESFSLSLVQNQMAGSLPTAMLPTRYLVLDEFPMTRTGKIDVAALQKLAGSAAAERVLGARGADTLLRGVVAAFERAFDRPIAATDDFFALGGDSLTAVSLIELISDSFRVDLSINDLIRYPTPASLCERIRVSVSELGATGIYKLSPAETNSATTPTLFFVPGLIGQPFGYRHLAAELTPVAGCYGLEFPGLSGGSAPAGRIETIATELNEKIYEVRAVGPIGIVAYSMGGLVAFEMAQRLVESGQPVAFLAFIDCYAPWVMQPISARLRAEGWLRFLANRSQNQRWTTVRRAAARRLRLALSTTNRVADRPKFAPEDPTGLSSRIDDPLVRRVMSETRAAVRAYRCSGELDADLLLFRASISKGPPHGSFDLFDEWRNRIGGEIREYVIPGDHHDMLLPEAAHVIAPRIEERLRAFPGPFAATSGSRM
ncbi:MAG: alpha/beta fold hydrolase [Gammaproteobacteria bacterium]